MLLPKPTHPVMAQRLFWLFRVVTSLFIGAVILGECEAQLPEAVPPSHLSHPVPSVPSGSLSSRSGSGGSLFPQGSLCFRVVFHPLPTCLPHSGRIPSLYPCSGGSGPWETILDTSLQPS